MKTYDFNMKEVVTLRARIVGKTREDARRNLQKMIDAGDADLLIEEKDSGPISICEEQPSDIVAFGFFEDEFPTACMPKDATSEILEPLTTQNLVDIINKLSGELTKQKESA